MRYDRQAAEALRQELGITEERGRGRLRHGVVVGTAGEVRALMEVLRLSRKQFSARFQVPLGTLQSWVGMESSAEIRVNEEKKGPLLHALVLGRERLLLKSDPRETKPRVPLPENLMVRYRCSQCGARLRKKDISEVAPAEFVHELPNEGGRCGPVQIEDRQMKRAHEQRVAQQEARRA